MFFSSWSIPAILHPVNTTMRTPYNHAPVYSVTSFKAIYTWLNVHLAGTCHLHFWQNDLDLLRAAAVTRVWNEYRNKSRHRKLTLEMITLPPFRPAGTWTRHLFITRSALYRWTIPAPGDNYCLFFHKEQNIKMTLLDAYLNAGVSPVVTV